MKTPRCSIASRRLASPDARPIIAFASGAEFDQWLEENHADHAGFWMRIYKKDSRQFSITYGEALDAALCHGWIDGQKRSGDAKSWLQRFTRRGPRSIWSKINTGHVERLMREGRMKPAGLAAVQAAKADGRWQAAYGSFRTFEMPADFNEALSLKPKAAAFFATLNKANSYAIYHRLTTAKRPETRARRLGEFIAMLDRGQRLH